MRIEWDLTYGPHAEWLAQAAEDRGEPIPEDAIPPEIAAGYVYAYAVFQELSADRQIGMALGPIPFTAIDAYARRFGIDDLDEFEQLLDDVAMIDRLFLKISLDKKPGS